MQTKQPTQLQNRLPHPPSPAPDVSGDTLIRFQAAITEALRGAVTPADGSVDVTVTISERTAKDGR